MSIAEVQSPVVTTESGMVMGKEKNGVFQFFGIPYAAPPVGENRFKRPQPTESWADIRDATRFGAAAPQLPSGTMTNSAPVRWDEDCLTLNICSPRVDSTKRPVLVWIHGGAYRTGQSGMPWYNGSSFAQNGDIVTVSMNYRLGALGFTDLSRFGDEFDTSGINGLLDQITALHWIQKNIEHFGGDPSRVTIAGESAGAFSVGTLIGSPRAKGLFHRAIPQSGAAHHTLSIDTGKLVADLFLEELFLDERLSGKRLSGERVSGERLSDEARAASLDRLMHASPQEILDAQGRADERYEAHENRGRIQAFYPVEGNNEVLPAPLLQLIAEGMGSNVPVLSGTNKDEMTMFLTGEVTLELLESAAKRYGGVHLLDEYRRLMPGANDTDIWIAMSTDFTFKIPAVRLAELRAKHGAETWLYQFDWESRAGHLKSTHALEIPFTFNTLNAPGVDVFIGPGELPQDLADEMHQVWISFVRGQCPAWPSYTPKARAVQHFDEVSAVIAHEDLPILSVWADIL